MIGGVEREGWDEIRLSSVSHETSSRVSIETDHEEEGQVVSVPERLEALCTNFVVGSGIHEHNDEKHDMTRDATRLSIVNLKCSLLADFYVKGLVGRTKIE